MSAIASTTTPSETTTLSTNSEETPKGMKFNWAAEQIRTAIGHLDSCKQEDDGETNTSGTHKDEGSDIAVDMLIELRNHIASFSRTDLAELRALTEELMIDMFPSQYEQDNEPWITCKGYGFPAALALLNSMGLVSALDHTTSAEEIFLNTYGRLDNLEVACLEEPFGEEGVGLDLDLAVDFVRPYILMHDGYAALRRLDLSVTDSTSYEKKGDIITFRNLFLNIDHGHKSDELIDVVVATVERDEMGDLVSATATVSFHAKE